MCLGWAVFLYFGCIQPLAAKLPQGQLPRSKGESRAESALPNADLTAFPPLDLTKCPHDEQGERIVAIVEGTTITEKRLMAELAFARAQQKLTQFPVARNKQEELGLLGALAAPVFDHLVERILLAKYAQKHGLVVTDEDIDLAIKKTNQFLPPGEKIEDMALRYGMSIQDMRELARTQILGRRLEETFADKVTLPTEEELRDFAARAVGVGAPGEEIRAAHILFVVPAHATTDTVERAHNMALEVRKQLLKGADFCELALRYSQDKRTASRCGDLGYLTKGKMPATFEEAAFRLEPGQISEVVRTGQGFHIIYVREKYNNCLRSSYCRHKQRELFLRWYEDLKRQARIEKFF